MNGQAARNPAAEWALGHAHRRVRVFLCWWAGMVLAVPAAVYAVAAWAFSRNPEIGLIALSLGLAFSGIGWLVSAPLRFTRKAPRPADDFARSEQTIRINNGAAIGTVVLMSAVSVALMFTPKGGTPEGLPLLLALAAVSVPFAVALWHTRRILVERDETYARWQHRLMVAPGFIPPPGHSPQR